MLAAVGELGSGTLDRIPLDQRKIGVVLIGRNEGERLVRCLHSVEGLSAPTVYVDSNSSDHSVANAQAAGVQVVALDMSKPFSAARARNAGVERLLEQSPDIEFIQFLDGDCELEPGWIAAAFAFLDRNPKTAVVCGRRRERFPEASTYNLLCDMEWDTPIGSALFFGGDALVRRTAFVAVGGYNPALIAGEEPDLSIRLRQIGWEIWRIDQPMTLHDADIKHFTQWWMRNIRGGHAYAEGFHMHGAPPENFCRHAVMSNYIWAMPLMWPLWPLLWLRVLIARSNIRYATFITLAKIPLALGQLKFQYLRLIGRRSTLIEYK